MTQGTDPSVSKAGLEVGVTERCGSIGLYGHREHRTLICGTGLSPDTGRWPYHSDGGWAALA